MRQARQLVPVRRVPQAGQASNSESAAPKGMRASCRIGAGVSLRMPGDAPKEFRVVETRIDLYAELHRPFALGAGDRLAARALLALLRLPVGARLLRAWHARRSR